MKKTVFKANVLLCSLVFFFAGIVTVNAQYVSNDEAVIILKTEILELQEQALTAQPEEQNELAFQYHYMENVAYDIQDGAEVGAAIVENEPKGKSTLNSFGLIHFTLTASDKAAIAALVAYVDDLLSD